MAGRSTRGARDASVDASGISNESRAATKSGPRQARSQSKLASSGQPARRESRATEAQEQTRDALYQEAAALGINGRSRMTKVELVRAIESHRNGGRQGGH